MRPMGPPPGEINQKLKEPKPKALRDVPGYVKRVVSKFFSRLFYIFRLVFETKPWILFVMLFFALFDGVMPVAQAYAGSLVLNKLAEAYMLGASGFQIYFPEVIKLLVFQFLLLLMNSVVSNLNTVVARISGELVANHVKVKIMRKAKDVDVSSFDRPEFYERLENANREASMRPIQILNASFRIISTLISIISFVVILVNVNPAAPAIVFALSVPSAIISFSFRNKNYHYMRRRSKERRQLNYYSDLMTDKDLSKEVRIFGLSDLFLDRYNGVFTKYFSGIRKLAVKEGVLNIGFSLVSVAANCALFIYIAVKVCYGEMPVGNFSLYTGALNSIATGTTTFISTIATIYEGTLFIDNVIEFMAERKNIIPISDKPIEPERDIGHTITLENVSFKYPGTDRYVLRNISATLKPGNSVVLVGINGAGKTTLIKLITRLYDPTEGRILLDGRDIREYDVSKLYDLFGIIFQDFGKYAVTVGENIQFGQIDEEIDEDNIVSAARQSNSESFINALPEKYNTPLMRYFENDGIELSVGQWQKLSVARAFYSKSDILILDEPTASLDAIAEQEIYNQFDELRRDKTTVFVSHRLSSATTADDILVLDNGELIEQGSHVQLMSLHGKYYELFSTQAKRYIENTDKVNDSPDILPVH